MTDQTTTPPAEAPAKVPRRVPPLPERTAKAAAASSEMPPFVDGGVSEDDPRRPGFVRQPFGSHALKLNAPQRPGYHRHWFNDDLDRIQKAKANGYAHVYKEGTQTPISRVVGRAKGGGPLTAYLMEIPKEWAEENFRLGQKLVDEIDDAIRGGNIARKDGDKRYVPQGGIKYGEDE